MAPEFPDILKVVTEKGFVAIVVTNQRGIARGLMTEDDWSAIHAHMVELLAEHGVSVLDVFHCPHENNSCTCRKPQAGMLLEAAQRHDLDLTKSWMVGDNGRDIEAGTRAGCRTIHVDEDGAGSDADHIVSSMAELRDCIGAWI